MAEKAGKARPRVVVFPYLAARLHARIHDAASCRAAPACPFVFRSLYGNETHRYAMMGLPTIMRFPVIEIGI